MNERLALDIRLWRDKSEEAIANDLASAADEQRQGSLTERVNVFTLTVDDFAKLQTGLSWKTESDRQENEAYFKILDWSQRNVSGFMLWISPSSAEYSESRFTVYQLSSTKEGKTLHGWAICGEETEEECLKVAEQIRSKPSDELRSNPFPFNPGNLRWTSFLSEFFGSPEIWQAIDSGSVEREKERIKAVAQKIAKEKIGIIRQSRTLKEAVVVGAMIEKAMEKRAGIVFQDKGSCGLSNSAVLEKINKPVQAYVQSNKRESKKGQYVKKCPFCHRKINSVIYPGYKCRCGQVYEGVCV
jgi:hypothetical protein